MAKAKKPATKLETAKSRAKSAGIRAAKLLRAAARKRKLAARPQAAKGVRGKSRTGAEGVIGRIPAAAPEAVPVLAVRPAIRDKILGRLAWNEGLGWYHGKIKFRNCPVDLCVVVEDKPEQLDELLGLSRAVISRLHILAHKAEDFARETLKELESARSGRAAPESEAMKFKRYMRLKAVEIHAGGRVTFLHDDGNAFWGHLIETTMGSDERVSEARVAA